jgi:hypothetical protein
MYSISPTPNTGEIMVKSRPPVSSGLTSENPTVVKVITVI